MRLWGRMAISWRCLGRNERRRYKNLNTNFQLEESELVESKPT